MLTWDTSIQYVKGVGEKRAALFAKLDIYTVEDLLKHFPRDYADWANPCDIDEAPLDEPCCLRVIIATEPREYRVRRGLVLYKFRVSDGKTTMPVTLFNAKYTAKNVHKGDSFLLYGKISGNLLERSMTSPQMEPDTGEEQLKPIYSLTAGLTSKAIEKVIRAALDGLGDMVYQDFLPQSIRAKYDLPDRATAFRQIHFPANRKEAENARRRLVFESLLVLQLGLMRMKDRGHSTTGVKLSADHSAEFMPLLPFEMTGAQKRAVSECMSDMQTGNAMCRLLQGDVGSGKTAVAAAVIHSLVREGYQAALMAPTEILAHQHAETFRKFLEPAGMRVEVLTASCKAAEKRRILEGLADGSVHLVVGTQALLSDSTVFQNLGLVVTDEQHRFGVHQRATLAAKGDNPHMLVMSATPIPRTLALILYGDLDLSILDELPPGRLPVRTYAVRTDMRDRIYAYIRKNVDAGRQAYIVCPLVEEGEAAEELGDDRVAATEYVEMLKKGALCGYSVGLLHGKMKPAEKDAVMTAFSKGDISILVSTTVIEVGVDVPNATLMVIENADLFGLAQLHQLRGRVGRGGFQSDCILISDSRGEEAFRRLKAMCATNDGFKIADEDLKMRGPGDFFGAKQSGLPSIKLLPGATDMGLLSLAQDEAVMLLKNRALQDSAYTALAKEVDKLFASVGEHGLN